MKGILKTYNVGLGDCISFQLRDGGDTFNVLIDCGYLTDGVRTLIHDDFKYKIDLLVVTHIDEDHISGVYSILSEMKDVLTIKHIWFNSIQCGADMNPRALTATEKQAIANLRATFSKYCQSTTGAASMEDAKLLTDVILSSKSWSQAWNDKAITTATDDFVYDNGRWGKFCILSPNVQYWSKQTKVYEDLFKRYLYLNDYTQLKDCQFLYELLCRLNMKIDPDDQIEGEPSSGSNLTEASVMAISENYKPIGLSVANQCSLAFVWEKNDKRILFMGDAHPNKVADAIVLKYKNMPKPIIFSVIKVAHHGSEHNVSKKLLQATDSNLFLLTGGEMDTKPSHKTLARLICNSLPSDGVGNKLFDKRRFLCNRSNNVIEDFRKAQPELTDKLFYEIEVSNPSVYEFEV